MNLRGIERRLAKLERKLNPRVAALWVTERSPGYSEAVAEAEAEGREIVVVSWLKSPDADEPQILPRAKAAQ